MIQTNKEPEKGKAKQRSSPCFRLIYNCLDKRILDDWDMFACIFYSTNISKI